MFINSPISENKKCRGLIHQARKSTKTVGAYCIRPKNDIEVGVRFIEPAKE